MASANLVLKQTLNVTCMKNDTFKLDMDWVDSSSNPIDLTAYTFKSQVKTSSVASTAILTFNDGDFTKDASGNLLMEKAAGDMDLSAGKYYYDIQATKTATSEVETWAGGLFIVQHDITE